MRKILDSRANIKLECHRPVATTCYILTSRLSSYHSNCLCRALSRILY